MVSPSCFGVSFELLLVNTVGGVLVHNLKTVADLLIQKCCINTFSFAFIAVLLSSYITKLLLNKIVLNMY